jgi:hypothetical protein
VKAISLCAHAAATRTIQFSVALAYGEAERATEHLYLILSDMKEVLWSLGDRSDALFLGLEALWKEACPASKALPPNLSIGYGKETTSVKLLRDMLSSTRFHFGDHAVTAVRLGLSVSLSHEQEQLEQSFDRAQTAFEQARTEVSQFIGLQPDAPTGSRQAMQQTRLAITDLWLQFNINALLHPAFEPDVPRQSHLVGADLLATFARIDAADSVAPSTAPGAPGMESESGSISASTLLTFWES